LIEFVDSDAPIRVGGTVIFEGIYAMLPNHAKELHDEDQNHENAEEFETQCLHSS
jgi:hypothetical protein